MSRATRVLTLIHFVGNALLLWLAYYWLSVGESTIGRLAWSAILAVLIAAAALWLHGTGFTFFRTDRSALSAPLLTALRNLLPLFLLAIAVVVVYGLLSWWRDYSAQPVFKIASYVTLKLRKPVKPGTVQTIFNGALWILRWVLLPVLLVPLTSHIANKGWRGFRPSIPRHWLYWLEVVVLLICGIWLPLKLITWVPKLSSFGMQMTSFVIRLLIGYLLFVTAWLLLELFTSRVKQLP